MPAVCPFFAPTEGARTDNTNFAVKLAFIAFKIGFSHDERYS
jgi:hypothetical protein